MMLFNAIATCTISVIAQLSHSKRKSMKIFKLERDKDMLFKICRIYTKKISIAVNFLFSVLL